MRYHVGNALDEELRKFGQGHNADLIKGLVQAARANQKEVERVKTKHSEEV